jgi:hypothetical protein
MHAGAVHRIAIVGPVASGKTTLAQRLGPRLDLPVYDLDEHYRREETLPTEAEWAATHRELVDGKRWIIAGDYRAGESDASAGFVALDLALPGARQEGDGGRSDRSRPDLHDPAAAHSGGGVILPRDNGTMNSIRCSSDEQKLSETDLLSHRRRAGRRPTG